MNKKDRQIIKTLNNLGVDTRYISLYNEHVYINNSKFSKFSRKKEEKFNCLYPNISVTRSMLFQKICVKVSRTIKNQIKPKDEIYIDNTPTAKNIVLNIVLESYKRKYGIKIAHTPTKHSIIVSSKCLDDFSSEYIHLMLSGNKITDTYEENTIYPLIHVHQDWIDDWISSTDIKHITSNVEENTKIKEMLTFLEKHIPNVNESIKQSVTYLDENRID